MSVPQWESVDGVFGGCALWHDFESSDMIWGLKKQRNKQSQTIPTNLVHSLRHVPLVSQARISTVGTSTCWLLASDRSQGGVKRVQEITERTLWALKLQGRVEGSRQRLE